MHEVYSNSAKTQVVLRSFPTDLAGYGLRSVCSRGNDTNTRAKVFYADLLQQTTWDMTNLNDPSFPTNTSGQPNLAYYFPLGALITQMIVLEAPNPRGANLGEIPAVVFRCKLCDAAGPYQTA